MLAKIIFTAGILLLIFAGYKALVLAKAMRRINRKQKGFFSIACNGDCGSAFEFILQMENGRISYAEAKGGHCAHSLICAQAASQLALGKTTVQLMQITAHTIAKKAGGLSPEHMHCAILAAHGLSLSAKKLNEIMP